jgi:hypothetical protein
MPDAAPPRSEDALKADDAHITTVEELVRGQLSRALGGVRGIAEGAVPTLGFTVAWIATHELRLALGISFGLATALLLVRVVQRSTVQFVLNSLVGISVAALFALRSGRAEDAFLPGLIYNTVYGVLLSASALTRWPLVGFMIGAVTGDPTGWRRDPQLVALCTKLTWLLAIPCFIRLAVQYPLWAAGEAGWLGVAKLSMGWPLQIAAFAAMIWILNRDRTPVAVPVRSG